MMSQVLQWTQFDALICSRGPCRRRARSRTHSPDRSACTDVRTPCRRSCGTPLSARADAVADPPRGACPSSARWSPCRTSAPGPASALGSRARGRARRGDACEQWPGWLGTADVSTSPRSAAQPSERQTPKQPVPERLMHVPHRTQLGGDPALPDLFVEVPRRAADVSPDTNRVERRFRREHSRLHRQMDALEPHRVQKAGRVADDERAVDGALRKRQPSPSGSAFAPYRTICPPSSRLVRADGA